MASGIKVRVVGKLTFDEARAANAMSKAIVLHILRRTGQRKDVDDRTLPAYSPLYAMQLASIGEPTTADLRRTGDMIRSIALRRIQKSRGVVSATFAPDGARSAVVHRPPPYVFDEKKTPAQRAEAFDKWRRGRKKSGRALPHNVVMLMLARGTANRKARRILGVSPAGRPGVIEAIVKSSPFRS